MSPLSIMRLSALGPLLAVVVFGVTCPAQTPPILGGGAGQVQFDPALFKAIGEIGKEIKLSKGVFFQQKWDYLYPSDHSIRIVSSITVNIQSGDFLYKNWQIKDKEFAAVGTDLPPSKIPQFTIYGDKSGIYTGEGGEGNWLSPQSAFDPSPYLDEMAGYISLKSCPFVLAFRSILDEQCKAAAANGNAPLLAYMIDEKAQLSGQEGPAERVVTSGPNVIKIKTFYDFLQSYSETEGGELVKKVDNRLLPEGATTLRPNNLVHLGSNNVVTIVQQYTTSFKPSDLVLGLLLHEWNGKTIITGILPGSAASRSELEKGEEVLRINGTDTSNLTDPDLLKLVKSADPVEITFKDNNNIIKRISIAKAPLGGKK